MTAIIPSRGSTASRVPRPRTSRMEQPISNVVDIVAAKSGDSTGTLYSSAKSWTAVSQLASLFRPALRNTLAMASRNITWMIGMGTRPSAARTQAIRPRVLDIGMVVVVIIIVVCMVSSPEWLAGRPAIGTGRPLARRSRLLGVLAAADDLVAGASRHVDPRIVLAIALAGAGARGVRGLGVVLAGLHDAVALLGLELGLGGRAGLRGDRHREGGGHGGSDEELGRLHESLLALRRGPGRSGF